jgi:hypothetical protein
MNTFTQCITDQRGKTESCNGYACDACVQQWMQQASLISTGGAIRGMAITENLGHGMQSYTVVNGEGVVTHAQ